MTHFEETAVALLVLLVLFEVALVLVSIRLNKIEDNGNAHDMDRGHL
jgi:hypothetical protein